MYAQIKQQKTTRARHAAQLVSEGVQFDVGVKQMEEATAVPRGRRTCRQGAVRSLRRLFVDWKPYLGHEDSRPRHQFPDEATSGAWSADQFGSTGFSMQKQVEKTYEDRRKMAAGGLPCNWGFAETLAMSLLSRISVFALPARMWVVEHSPIAKRPCTIKTGESIRRFNISLKSNHV